MITILKIFLIPICFFGWLFNDDKDKDLKAFENILYQSAKILEKKYNLNAMGSGGSIPEGVIKNFTLSFQKNDILTKDECRRLIVNLTLDFLKIINSNKEVRPFLSNYPFDENNISLNLFVDGTNGIYPEHPDIGVVSLILGKIVYVTQKIDYKKKSIKRISEEEESFEDALRIVKSNQKS